MVPGVRQLAGINQLQVGDVFLQGKQGRLVGVAAHRRQARSCMGDLTS